MAEAVFAVGEQENLFFEVIALVADGFESGGELGEVDLGIFFQAAEGFGETFCCY